MKPLVTLAKSGPLMLQERDGEFVIRINGLELMSTRRHVSESKMAQYAKGEVLIGGLGLCFTLRSVLATEAKRVVVAELYPAVVEWNRTYLKNADALDDPRVSIHLGDVGGVEGRFDAILLDVDNGPHALCDPKNAKLYDAKGIARFKGMLKPKGSLVVWAAGPDDAFVKALGRGGFEARTETSAGKVLFVARID